VTLRPISLTRYRNSMPESSMSEERHIANIKQLIIAARHFTSSNLIKKGNFGHI
jgi:hypothetical protein